MDANDLKLLGKNIVQKDAIKALPSAQSEPSTEIQEILDYLDNTLHPIISPDNWNVYSELHDMVSKLPSVQPEIIKCKDCDQYNAKYRWCRLFETDLASSDFCSLAERR